MSKVLEDMKRECREKIHNAIGFHEIMIKNLKERLEQVDDGDLHTIVSLNACLAKPTKVDE